MRLSDFDYELPTKLIAQEAAPVRDTARLLRLDRATGERSHHRVADLDTLLEPGDVLVVNDTRVVPARLLGRREPSGGAVECLLLARLDAERWDALVHPGQKLKVGSRAVFEGNGRRLQLEVLARHYHGRRTVRLAAGDGWRLALAPGAPSRPTHQCPENRWYATAGGARSAGSARQRSNALTSRVGIPPTGRHAQ